jgi:hypothetical protein
VIHFYPMNSHERRIVRRMLEQAGLEISESGNRPPVPQELETQQRLGLSRALKTAARLHGRLWKVALAMATLGGLGVWQLWPLVSIEPYASSNPHDPFDQFFFVENQSVYPIRTVEIFCGIDDVRLANGSRFSDFSVTTKGNISPMLGRNEKWSFTCDLGPVMKTLGFTSSPTKLEIDPWVRFALPFGISMCRYRHFSGVAASDGTFVWTWRGGGPCPRDWKRQRKPN